MTKIELGRLVFAAIKEDLKNRGLSMDVKKFPSDYPISRRTCYNIRKGYFNAEILQRLPFTVTVGYQVKI